MTYYRPLYSKLLKRLKEPRRFIQVLAGPRQVGKTTLAQQLLTELSIPSHYASAEAPTLQGRTWIEQQWDIGRLRIQDSGRRRQALLILDEVQKIPAWSEVVKRLWDQDSADKTKLKVLLLGSSPLLLQRGLTESLAGRFEVIPVPHWSFSEMSEAFRWKMDQYIYFGGFPVAAPLIKDEARWRHYIIDSLVETTVSRDILLMTRVDKPALLRQLFQLGCSYSGQILSYQKMLGQLQEAGNTTTLAHYLTLLDGAGLLTGLSKYAGQRVRQRASSPKLQVQNTALMSAYQELGFREARRTPETWGRLVESAIGAHLINSCRGTEIEVFYWNERNKEVDFILKFGKKVVALEVKSGRKRERLPGMLAFDQAFHPQRKLLVGAQGISIEEFLSKPAASWL